MALAIYWTMKIFAWTGIVFSLYSIIQPVLMQRLFLVTIRWKLKWFGFQGNVEPAANAAALTRLWSLFILMIFLGINYLFGNVITLNYVLQN